MIETSISPSLLLDLTDRAFSFEHVVLVMDTPNKNGRTYPTDVVAQAIANLRYPIFGCFMNDLGGATIPIEFISHKVSDLRIEDNKLIAKIRILQNTLYGSILQSLTDATGEQDYRTSGQTMLDPNNVVTQFQLVSIGALSPGQGA